MVEFIHKFGFKMSRFTFLNIFTSVFLILSYTMNFTHIMAYLLILWILLVSIGVCSLRFELFIDCFPKKKIEGKVVITIDDGPDPFFTPSLLALLKKYKIEATFFLVGKQAKKYPQLLQSIFEAGHTIASHSYSHLPWLNFYLAKHWKDELLKTESVFGGYMKYKWFRPPFALMSPHLASALKKRLQKYWFSRKSF